MSADRPFVFFLIRGRSVPSFETLGGGSLFRESTTAKDNPSFGFHLLSLPIGQGKGNQRCHTLSVPELLSSSLSSIFGQLRYQEMVLLLVFIPPAENDLF